MFSSQWWGWALLQERKVKFLLGMETSNMFSYIGKSTQQFRRRHSGQKQEIKNVIGGLGHHYGGARGCGYTNISMQIIEKVNQGDHTQLAKREVYWQNEIRCFVQNGGGGHCYRKEK